MSPCRQNRQLTRFSLHTAAARDLRENLDDRLAIRVGLFMRCGVPRRGAQSSGPETSCTYLLYPITRFLSGLASFVGASASKPA